MSTQLVDKFQLLCQLNYLTVSVVPTPLKATDRPLIELIVSSGSGDIVLNNKNEKSYDLSKQLDCMGIVYSCFTQQLYIEVSVHGS